MGLRTVVAALLPALAAAQKVFNVDVGKTGLIFQPESLNAPAGSVVNFHFYPGDHSVAQSNFDKPCQPSGPDAIYSGFFNPHGGVDSTMFTLTINDTSPLWLYCSAPSHCEAGMSMVINPPGSGNTLSGYQTAAATISSSESPAQIAGGIMRPNSNTGPSPSTGSGSGTGPNSAASAFLNHIANLRTAHGAIMALCVVVLFPMGALWMRLLGFKGLVWFHAGWQIFTLALFTAGFGIGVVMARQIGLLYTGLGKTHTTFGTVLFSLIWLQLILGFSHHFVFVKKQKRTAVSHAHIWYGRALLILMIINGGLGAKLVDDLGVTSNARGVEIAYGVVAGIVGVIYIAASAFGEFRRSKTTTAAPSSEPKEVPTN